MKNKFGIIGILLLLPFMSFFNHVYAKSVGLFTICEKGGSCVTITSATINNNQKYNFFEIKDKEIYLNNSIIDSFTIHNTMNQDYRIHVSGANKITLLSNTIENSSVVPLFVDGTGALQIDTVNMIKKNTSDEIYFNQWYFTGTEDMNGINPYLVTKKITFSCTGPKCEEDKCTFSLPEGGITKTDIITNYEMDEDYYYFGHNNEECYTQEDDSLTADSYPHTIEDMFTIISLNGIVDVNCCTKGMSAAECRKSKITWVINNGYLAASDPVFIPTIPTQLLRDWAEVYIRTDLPRTFTETGSYLVGTKPEEPQEENIESITTTQTNNIVFESTVAFDSNYHLNVDDITEDLTDEQSSNIQAKTDKILVKLYDINMLDKDNKIVLMENGTYTIKIKLSDLLKKYNDYQIIYIDDDNKVELLPTKEEDDYILFNTTHLSKYGIVGLEKTTKKIIDVNNQEIKNPQTADSVVTYVLALISFAIAVILVVFRIRKLKEIS